MPQPALTEPALPTPWPQTAARVLLGATLAFAGISHLTFARKGFQAQVPKSLPFSEDFTVLASGAVEISLGVALMALRRQRVPLGLTAAAFFVAVFPGNIAQYLNHADGLGLDTDTKRLVRLPFQPVLVAWALWGTGAWSWLRGKAR
jgi:uncharacterized membrane protein